MMFRTSILATLAATTLLVTACAAPGRGDVDDDDGSSSDDGSLTTTGSGTNTSSTGSGSGSGSGTGGSTASSSSSGPATTGGATCTYSNLTFNDALCGGCVETACCTSLQTCDGSTLCLDFVDCLSPCTDQLCADGCIESHPSGSIEYDTLNNCMNNSCPTECGSG